MATWNEIAVYIIGAVIFCNLALLSEERDLNFVSILLWIICVGFVAMAVIRIFNPIPDVIQPDTVPPVTMPPVTVTDGVVNL